MQLRCHAGSWKNPPAEEEKLHLWTGCCTSLAYMSRKVDVGSTFFSGFNSLVVVETDWWHIRTNAKEVGLVHMMEANERSLNRAGLCITCLLSCKLLEENVFYECTTSLLNSTAQQGPPGNQAWELALVLEQFNQ